MNRFEYVTGPEQDDELIACREKFPLGSWVYLELVKQLGVVEEIRPSPDGPRVKVKHVGSVPASELRPATDKEVESVMTPEEFKEYLATQPRRLNE